MKVAKKAAAKWGAAQADKRPSRIKENPGTKPKAAAGRRERPATKSSATNLINGRIKELGDWRAKTLQRVREIIKEADPDIVEEWKWAKPTNPGIPVWSYNGIICTGETYREKVKLTFAQGASLQDPSCLFNASLEGKVRRAIDIRENDTVGEAALKELVRAAVALNSRRNAATGIRLLRFPNSVKRDPAVDTWMKDHAGDLGAIAQYWFEIMRGCGNDVRELLHDGHPTACVADAAFAYVNVFQSHVNVGFFRGAELSDPNGLLEGTGKFMRHAKLRPDGQIDARALKELIRTAYALMKKRLEGVKVRAGIR